MKTAYDKVCEMLQRKTGKRLEEITLEDIKRVCPRASSCTHKAYVRNVRSKLRIEGKISEEKTIVCRDCGQRVFRLNYFHFKTHSEGMTKNEKEYKERYGEEVSSQEFVERCKESANDPDNLERHRQIMVDRYEDPEEIRKITEINREICSRPERNKRVSEGNIIAWRKEEVRRSRIDGMLRTLDERWEKIASKMQEKWRSDKAYIEGMKRRTKLFSGSGHWNWKGGKRSVSYPVEFTEELKEEIRERDKRKCRICYKTEEEENQRLAVHHVDYDKSNYSKDNLLTLCMSCHARTNFKRDWWRLIFFFHTQKNRDLIQILDKTIEELLLDLDVNAWVKLICEGYDIFEGLKNIASSRDLDFLLDRLVEKLHEVGFPYPELGEKDQISRIDNLRKIEFEKFFLEDGIKYNTGSAAIPVIWNREIWDMPVRGQELTPLQQFKDPAILKRLLKGMFDKVTHLSQGKFLQRFKILTKVTGSMSPATAAIIYKKYEATGRILDPCAGFGGRMLGACGLGLDYTGIDIREEAKNNLQRMANLFGFSPRLVCEDFCNFDEEKYSFAFTSPPFWIQETYDLGFTDFESWTENFVKDFSKNLFRLMGGGARVILHLANYWEEDVVGAFEDKMRDAGFILDRQDRLKSWTYRFGYRKEIEDKLLVYTK